MTRLLRHVSTLSLCCSAAGVAGIALPCGASAQTAPVVETVLPFDSAGRLTVITPSIASRLRLSPPAWPVSGSYQEARLYLSSRDGYILVVRLTDGAINRYGFTDAELADLTFAVCTINSWNRLAISSRTEAGTYQVKKEKA